ncbi:RING-type E3 ubiquitin transferase [Quillaja saponaria]|uniref:RING-type E3 ubiquitin transferase n=1 Tax=Quillaja saponaria TaxID=32244 RepID=A0AAD7LC28_QUISA|nr:RING-type E3 ubiquitin transferase [Quillaja saponaria]
MSNNPNTSTSLSSSSSLLLSHEYDRADLKSIWEMVALINQYILGFIENPKTRNSLKLRCSSKLRIEKQEFFEFSDHAVLSNLYWGIDNIDAAIQTEWPEEKSYRLSNSEQMLQPPAMLDEQEVTARIPNSYLVCCSYFYLSVVRKLQRDEWQAALHFLQAVLVSPILVRTDFAPELCESLFPSSIISGRKADSGSRSLESVSLRDIGEDESNQAIRHMAKRYKECLMYHQVMLYGETPPCHSLCIEQSSRSVNETSSSSEFPTSVQHRQSLQTHHTYEKVHPLEPHDYVADILEDDLKENMDDRNCSPRKIVTNTDDRSQEISHQFGLLPESLSYHCLKSDTEWKAISLPQVPQYPMHEETDKLNITMFYPNRFSRSISDMTPSILEHTDKRINTLLNCHVEDESIQETLQPQKLQLFEHIAFKSSQPHNLTLMDPQERAERKFHNSSSLKDFDEVFSHSTIYSNSDLLGILENTITKLHLSEGLAKCEEDNTADIATIYEKLSSKSGVKYAILKDVILDQLLTAISTSQEKREIRASVSILTTIISRDKSVVEYIKKKGLSLCYLASALKQNVHEAAILIYLINPSPIEIKTMELLPTLVQVICTSSIYKPKPASLQLTPPAASLLIIEVLITSFDSDTNNMHLAAISSPHVLCGIIEVARNNSLEIVLSLTTILVKCMQFDGQCRKYLSESTPVAPFIHLLQTDNNHAKSTALEFLHELLRMPPSSSISLLQRIQKEGSINFMHLLKLCLHQLQPDYQLLAANILLQLDKLENSPGKVVLTEEATQVLLKSVASEENCDTQVLSAFILSNLGGMYDWTGEPYTVAWLLRKAGLTSPYHRSMIRNFNWLDQRLQGTSTDMWCSKLAQSILSIGNYVFHALEKGLKSKIKRVSRDCLIAIAWLGCEITKSPDSLRHSACNILLSGIEQFLHPGHELEERLLACLCIYNYASGKGMQKVIHFSEGVKESLRRLSNVTWMAEELHKVADYILPNKSRISCVHTQFLEVGDKSSGAVCSLIYYKGLLCSGYSNGSIKVWKMVQRKLECVEVIDIKEPIHSLQAYGQNIFVITQGQRMKVVDESRKVRDIFKGKRAKCVKEVQGKLYIGCTDSSMLEYSVTYNRDIEIKTPSRSWRRQTRPVDSIVTYKDWLYCASVHVEGSTFKEWRRHEKPQISILTGKDHVLAMEVVEDFLYLNSSSSENTIQIWLRGAQKKMGRISAGSKITSLLAANDVLLCGTETGLIKGWIPL